MKPKKENSTMGRPKGQKKAKLSPGQLVELKKQGVKKILNEHYSRKQFHDWVKEEWDLSLSRAKPLWHEVWELVETKYELSINQMVVKHAHHYWNIFELSKENGDYTNARNTLNDIAKLFNLTEGKKVEINKGDEVTFKFGDE